MAAMTDPALIEPLANPLPAHSLATDPLYNRLSITDIGLALSLHDEGRSQVEIAQRLGKNQSSVSRLLKKLAGDSSQVATRLLKARAYKSAVRVAHIAEKSQRTDEALKAAKVVLAASGVLSTGSSVSVGVQVVLGQPGSSALDASAITVTQGNHNADYQTQRESVGLTAQQVTGATNVAVEAKGGGER